MAHMALFAAEHCHSVLWQELLAADGTPRGLAYLRNRIVNLRLVVSISLLNHLPAIPVCISSATPSHLILDLGIKATVGATAETMDYI